MEEWEDQVWPQVMKSDIALIYLLRISVQPLNRNPNIQPVRMSSVIRFSYANIDILCPRPGPGSPNNITTEYNQREMLIILSYSSELGWRFVSRNLSKDSCYFLLCFQHGEQIIVLIDSAVDCWSNTNREESCIHFWQALADYFWDFLLFSSLP